jgi:exosortase/archaeosortase family protein
VKTAAPSGISALALPRVRDRDVLLTFLAGLAIAVCWRGSMAHWPWDVATAFLRDRSGIGAAELLAIGVLVWLVAQLGDEERLSPSDFIVIALTSLAFAFPLRLAASVPLTMVGLKLAFRREPRISSIGQVLLALAVYEWVGPVLFHVLSPLALNLEAFAVQAVLAPLGGFTRDGVTIMGSNGHGVSIEEGCSAFHNLSLSTLIWVSLVKLDTLTMNRAHLWIAAAMAAATIALNTARIALMAQSYAMYDYWHNGAGVPIVSFAMLAAILVICLGGLRLVPRS